jgi:hypothetical protein
MDRRRHTLLLGLVMVPLLAVEIESALLWPMPSGAEQASARVEVGTPLCPAHVAAITGPEAFVTANHEWHSYHDRDGSTLTLTLGPRPSARIT